MNSSRLDNDFVRHNIGALLAHTLVYSQGLFIVPILVKTVGVGVYGGYALVIATLGIICGISSLGVAYRSRRHLPSALDNHARRELFYPPLFFNALMLGVCTAVVFLFRSVTQRWLSAEGVTFNFALVPLYFGANLIFSHFVDYYRYTNRPKIMNVASIVFPYLAIGAMLALVYYNLAWVTIDNLVLIQALAMGVVAVPLVVKTVLEIGIAWPAQQLRQYWADIWLGFPIVLQSITDIVIAASDRYVLAACISVVAVGYYSPAYGLGSLILFFPRALGSALPQLLSRAVDAGHELQGQRMLNYAMSMFMLVGIPFVVGSAVLSKPLLVVLANREVASQAFLVLPLVAAGSVFCGLSIIISNVLFVKKQTTALFRMNAIPAVVNLALNLLLLSTFKSIVIAGATTLLSYVLGFILYARAVSVDWHLDFRPVVLLKGALAAGVMAALLIGLSSLYPARQSESLFLLAEILVGAVVYGIVVLISGGVSRREVDALWRLATS